MKMSMKKQILLLLLCGLLLATAGCKPQVEDEYPENQVAMTASINDFKDAVEAFDIDQMLGFLVEDNTGNLLTIVQGDTSYDKTYATLQEELRAMEDKQLLWRQPVSEGGFGYKLSMELSTIIYSNLSSNGAFASVPFVIKEQAEGIPLLITDRGMMICEMVKREGIWLCNHLTVNFNVSPDMASNSGTTVLTKYRPEGFGFGNLLFNF